MYLNIFYWTFSLRIPAVASSEQNARMAWKPIHRPQMVPSQPQRWFHPIQDGSIQSKTIKKDDPNQAITPIKHF